MYIYRYILIYRLLGRLCESVGEADDDMVNGLWLSRFRTTGKYSS